MVGILEVLDRVFYAEVAETARISDNFQVRKSEGINFSLVDSLFIFLCDQLAGILTD